MEKMRTLGWFLIGVVFLFSVAGCWFFEEGYDNFRAAKVSPFITDIQELPGTGLTSIAHEGVVYVLGVQDGQGVLFRSPEGSWSWDVFSVPETVFEAASDWDGKDYHGPSLHRAMRSVSGVDILSLEFMSDTINFDGSIVTQGTNENGFLFSFGGTDYTVSESGSGGASISETGTTTIIADLDPAADYTYGDVTRFSECDGTYLHLLSWPAQYDNFDVKYSELRLVKIPLATIGTWASLSYPYGGEEIMLESLIGMKGFDKFSLGLERLFFRKYFGAYLFSLTGELLIDASTAGISDTATISKVTGKLYEVQGNRLYEYTIP